MLVVRQNVAKKLLPLLRRIAISPRVPSSNVFILHCLALKSSFLYRNPAISTSLFVLYSKIYDLISSWKLFDDPNIPKDLISWNAMISACNYNHSFQNSFSLFQRMTRQSISFDSTTLLILLTAISDSNYLKLGKAVHGICLMHCMMDCRNNFLYNALIDMYAKCEDLDSSEVLFAQMEFRYDITTWNSIMGGCALNDQHVKSLHYFIEMMNFSGVHADSTSLSCAVSSCLFTGKFRLGASLHGFAVKSGFDNQSVYVSVANSLISLYSHNGDVDDAEKLFQGVTIANDVVSWNSMLDGFAENGMVSKAFDLVRQMTKSKEEQTIQLDSVTVVTLLPLCIEFNLLRCGKTIHGYAIRKGMDKNISVTNSLMDMYSKCNDLRYGERLFRINVAHRDLISWNTMIAGYSHNGFWREAQVLFRKFLQSRCTTKCSLSTVLAILSSCCHPESLPLGKSIHGWLCKSGYFPGDSFAVLNALMLMYIECDQNMQACHILLMVECGGAAATDIISWNTVIVGCSQNDIFREALHCFVLMKRHGVNPDTITLANVISVFGRVGMDVGGKLLHGVAIKSSLESDLRVLNALLTMYSRCDGDIESAKRLFQAAPSRNLCSWNCMISGFVQNEDAASALQLFHHMKYEPNEMTFVSILSACTLLSSLIHGREVNGRVMRLGLLENAYVSSSLINMYSKCGKLDTAVQIFRTCTVNSIASWNTMISAYGFHGEGGKALELFTEMCDSGMQATKSTFVSLLSACSHCGLVDEGLMYYHNMLDVYGVKPTTEHQVCVVDMLGRAGMIGEACEFIQQMETLPEPGVLGALLSATCRDHGYLEMGGTIAEQLFSLDSENAGYYVSLCNIYAAAGRWSDAIQIRGMAQDRGLKKPPACAWIQELILQK